MGIFNRFFAPPSRDRFGQMVLSAMKEAGEPGKFTYDAQGVRILIHDDSGKQIGESFLGNVYQEYCDKPSAERPASVATVVRSTSARHKEPSDELDSTMPNRTSKS